MIMVHSTGKPPSLAQVELHPILCPIATTAKCVHHRSCPQPQHQAGCWRWVWRGQLPTHLEDCEALSSPPPPPPPTNIQCVCVCVCVCVYQVVSCMYAYTHTHPSIYPFGFTSTLSRQKLMPTTLVRIRVV